MPKAIQNQNKLWGVTLIISLIVALIFLLPHLSVIILSCLMAFIFFPLYKKLKRRKEKSWGAATTTVITSLLCVIIPTIIVLSITVGQLINLAETLLDPATLDNMAATITNINNAVNTALAPLGVHINLTEAGIAEFLRGALPEIARSFGQSILDFLSSLPQLLISTVIYSFVFAELLVNHKRYIKGIYGISPFVDKITDHYLERVGLTANAMVKGQLIISLIISAMSVILLLPLGYGPYAMILFVLFTILNFIPLGCGVVMFPLIIYSGLTGQFWMALLILILYCLAANADSVLRPIFIPKKIQPSAALVMVSTFCGIAYFGILGVVYGPIIMIFVTTAISLYQEHTTSRAI